MRNIHLEVKLNDKNNGDYYGHFHLSYLTGSNICKPLTKKERTALVKWLEKNIKKMRRTI